MEHNMEKTNQQKQVKQVFENHADKWFRKATQNKKNAVNMIKQRNNFVEKLAKKTTQKKSKLLDVGCGTGDLVISLRKSNFDAFGIDFAESMIKKANSRSKNLKNEQKIFEAISFFDYKTESKYKIISANGFIEYISENELNKFLKNSFNMLEKNGLIVFSSRNRLFNVFSNNEYTKSEIKLSNLNELSKEATIFNESRNFNQVLKTNFKSKIRSNLKTHNRKTSDISVDTRYQYTPFQIIELLKKYKFKPIEIHPIHIHIFPTNSRFDPPEIHDYVSNLVQNQEKIPIQFITQSSSFMIVARKNE